MFNPASIKDDLYELAAIIQPDDIDAATRLCGLGDAVEQPMGPRRAAWAASNIQHMINPDLIMEQYRERHLNGKTSFIEVLELIRNMLIFAPILFTWLSISQATDQYNKFVTSLPPTTPNQAIPSFLSLWLQGFNGKLPSWLTLSNIAALDALILSIIIILTFLIYLFANTNRRKQELRAMNLHTRLVHVLSGATLCLNDRMTAPENLEATARLVEDMSQRILISFDTFEKRLTTQFDGITSQLVNQFNKIEQEMLTQLQQGSHYLQQLGKTASTINHLTKGMNDAAQLLREANSDLTKGIQELLGPAQDLSRQQQQLLDSASQSLSLLQDNAKTLNALGREQKSWGEDLADALDTLKIETQKSADITAQFAQSGSRQDQFLLQLTDERKAQSELAARMSSATQGMQDALRTMHASTDALRQIAVDTNDLMRLYASLPRSMHTDMHTILDGYGGAAQQVEKGGRDLSESAISIITASQHLETVLDKLEKRLTHI